MKNGLKSRFFRLGGVHHGGWWTPIFVFLDAADRMAIGAKLYYHAKVGSFRDSIRVLRESIRVLPVCLQMLYKLGDIVEFYKTVLERS